MMDLEEINEKNLARSKKTKYFLTPLFTFHHILGELEYLIKTCLSLELFNEAYDYVEQLINHDEYFLNEEERNLFMKTEKAKFSYFRNGWKNLLDFEQTEGENNLIPKRLIDSEMIKLEKDIKNFCLHVVEIVSKLEKVVEDDINAVIFYKKMQADYLRYYSEVLEDESEFTEYKEKSEMNYKEAYDKCLSYLEPHNPLTLSVALNYSVFAYSILDDTKRAFNIADNIYRQAILKLNTETKVPEVEALIKSLEENLTIWKIELDEN